MRNIGAAGCQGPVKDWSRTFCQLHPPHKVGVWHRGQCSNSLCLPTVTGYPGQQAGLFYYLFSLPLHPPSSTNLGARPVSRLYRVFDKDIGCTFLFALLVPVGKQQDAKQWSRLR